MPRDKPIPRIAILGILILVAVGYLSYTRKPSNDGAAQVRSAQAFADRTLAATTGRSAKWLSLRTEVFSPPEIALELFYSHPPSTTAEAKRDTEAVVRGALKTLMSDGRHPAKEQLFIWVYALQKVKGETGTDRLVTFGKARYNPATDSISFEAPRAGG